MITKNIDVCDMEGGSIAQVCKYNKMPLLMLKGISDYVGQDLEGIYDRYSQVAISNLQKELVKILSRV